MSAALQRALALWAALLAAIVCLLYLPLSRPLAVTALLALWMAIGLALYRAGRQTTSPNDASPALQNLPAAHWRQPVVLVCGDLPYAWPDDAPLLTGAQGCWIRVDEREDVAQVVRQLLRLRPHWARQLAVLAMICPQHHREREALRSRLHALRWQIAQARRESGQAIPLVLGGQIGSVMCDQAYWQAALPAAPITVWRESAATGSAAAWLPNGDTLPLPRQVLFNSLLSWLQRDILPVLTEANPDVPAVAPGVLLWGGGPALSGALPASLWTDGLQRQTALRQVAGWQAAEKPSPTTPLLPDFILPLLPQGYGITPPQRAACRALGLLALAAGIALCSSAWQNRQLLRRLTFDIARYQRIPMDDYGAKAGAVAVLRQDVAELDRYAREGAPPRLGLGLYKGERLRLPLLNAIRTYVPPPPPPKAEPAPTIVRLDSMALFDSGRATLKPGSTKMLVNSLVDIKAKPGWLIVVSGHTDNTGDPQRNQQLSLRRAEAVRDWMRDTGDVPESCFAVQGYGADRPVAPNDTAAGRAANRRVEISLVPQADACRLPGAPQPSSRDDDVTDN